MGAATDDVAGGVSDGPLHVDYTCSRQLYRVSTMRSDFRLQSWDCQNHREISWATNIMRRTFVKFTMRAGIEQEDAKNARHLMQPNNNNAGRAEMLNNRKKSREVFIMLNEEPKAGKRAAWRSLAPSVDHSKGQVWA